MGPDASNTIYLQQLEQRVQFLEQFIAKITLSDKYLFQKPLIGGPNGLRLGSAALDKIGFHQAAPIAQPSSSAQAAVGTTSATQSSPWGYATAGQADGIVTLVNRLRLDLVNLGIIKGSA